MTEKSSFPSGSAVKNLLAMWESWVRSLGQEDPLEKGMATHSSILAWRIPWTEEPGGLQSMGSPRARHNWATELAHMTANYVDAPTPLGNSDFKLSLKKKFSSIHLKHIFFKSSNIKTRTLPLATIIHKESGRQTPSPQNLRLQEIRALHASPKM